MAIANRLRRASEVLLFMLAATWVASSADAQSDSLASRFDFRLESGVGTMLSRHQRETLGYTRANYHVTARVAFRFVEPLSVGIAAGYWGFPSDQGHGYVTPVSIGFRVEPRVRNVGRFFVDLNFAPSRTGDLWRLTTDTGIGMEFDVTRFWALGPVFRYVQVFQPERQQSSADARYWAAGLSMAFHVAPSRHRDEVEATSHSPEPSLPPPTAPSPGAPRATVVAEEIRIDTPVLFVTDSARLVGVRTFQVLDAVVDVLSRHPDIPHVRIEGHTDERANEAYNLELSRRRAEAVRAHLVARGVSPARLSAEGFGESRRICRERQDDCRARNRRVEFHITQAGIR